MFRRFIVTQAIASPRPAQRLHLRHAAARKEKPSGVAKARPIPGQIVVSPTDGPRLHDRILQMKDPWLDEILSQGKTVEVRGQPTKLCGLWLGRHMGSPM